jgi:predicted P-loop ATPase/GTPase
MRTTSVQSGNGEVIIDSYLNSTNPILMSCSNETYILVSQQIKEF